MCGAKGIWFVAILLINRIWVLYSSLKVGMFLKQATFSSLGEQGWHSSESTRLPPMCCGFDSLIWCHKWVEFVVGS